MTRAKKFLALGSITAGVVAAAVGPALADRQHTAPSQSDRTVIMAENRQGATEPATSRQGS